jgi:hypothetical protein
LGQQRLATLNILHTHLERVHKFQRAGIPHYRSEKLRLRNVPLGGIIGILVMCKDIYACRTAAVMAILPFMLLCITVMMCAPVGATVVVGMMGMCICVAVAVCVGMDILTWGLTKQQNKGCGPLGIAFVHAITHG